MRCAASSPRKGPQKGPPKTKKPLQCFRVLSFFFLADAVQVMFAFGIVAAADSSTETFVRDLLGRNQASIWSAMFRVPCPWKQLKQSRCQVNLGGHSDKSRGRGEPRAGAGGRSWEFLRLLQLLSVVALVPLLRLFVEATFANFDQDRCFAQSYRIKVL